MTTDRHSIRGWLPQRNEDALVRLIEENDVKSVIEIGSFLGRSTALFAEKCEIVMAIDPFVIWKDFIDDNQERDGLPDDFLDLFLENMRALVYEDKVLTVRASSQLASRVLPNISADLVYIDAAHDEESVKKDIELWLPRARKIICGDDYGARWPGVAKAVDSLLPDREVAGDSTWYKLI